MELFLELSCCVFYGLWQLRDKLLVNYLKIDFSTCIADGSHGVIFLRRFSSSYKSFGVSQNLILNADVYDGIAMLPLTFPVQETESGFTICSNSKCLSMHSITAFSTTREKLILKWALSIIRLSEASY